MSRPGYCVSHPEIETRLRCGRCDDPVCPQCLVHSPVGVRCGACAQMKQLPTFEVDRGYMTRAVLAGVAISVGGGILVSLILAFVLPFPFLNVIAMVGLGYLIGEGISVAINRKRGRSLRYVAGGCVLLAYLVMALFGLAGSLFGLLALALAVYVAVNRL